MRTIEWTNAIKRDFKRVKANPYHKIDIDTRLDIVFNFLIDDKLLPRIYHDHALIGNWAGYRECHIKPDLLLIYKLDEPNLPRLMRLGSHSELFR